jgi:hypothetical protein
MKTAPIMALRPDVRRRRCREWRRVRNHPNIAEARGMTRATPSTRQDATRFATDFRDVYGTILKLAGLLEVIVPAILQLDSGPAQYYWTTPNFDLGFLP